MRAGSQSGQALIPAMVFAILLAGGSLLVFTWGQAVNDKLRLQNAADAAAYSAALWEARSLNFQAYSNRAIVANEVAIAQFVSLRSWSSYVGRTLGNLSRVTTWLPSVGQALAAAAQGWSAVDQTLQTALPPLESAISHWDADVLVTAESVMHQQAIVGAADLVTQVTAVNEPRAVVSTATRLLQVRNAKGWQDALTAKYRRGSGELARFGSLLTDARDGFSASRRAEFVPSNPLVSVTKRGGTDLIGEYSWRGMDTLSVHINYLLGSAEIPLGWGAAENRLQPIATRGYHGGSWQDNPRASRLADRAMLVQQGYAGLPEIRDIIRPNQQTDLRLRYAVALSLPGDRIRTADRELTSVIELPDGDAWNLKPAYSADALHALAAAELYFRRPVPRADGRQEYPSLFNPYWQAHLVDVDATERALTAPSRGLGIDPFAVLP
jgi:hypothetical protein